MLWPMVHGPSGFDSNHTLRHPQLRPSVARFLLMLQVPGGLAGDSLQNMLAGDAVTPGARLLRCKREPTSPRPVRVIGRCEPGGRAAPSFSVQLGSRSGRLGPGTLEGSRGLNDRGPWKLPHEVGGLLPGRSPRALGAQLCLRDAPCHVFRGRAPLAGGLAQAFLPFSVTMAGV